MARPRIFRDWQRPDLDRLREASVRPSSIRAGSTTVLIDGKAVSAQIPAGPGEVVIPEGMRDELIAYIERLEALIDERIGRHTRENPPLTSCQMTAIDIEVKAGLARKQNMRFGLTAGALADQLTALGLTGEDGISADTIDAWRRIPAYRTAYIERLAPDWDDARDSNVAE